MSGMYAFLKRPRWLGAIFVVLVIATVLVRLGLWQLERHRERQIENEVVAARLEAGPEPLALLLGAVGDDLESLEFRSAIVEGAFDPSAEVLLRGQVHDGLPGFDIVTPFITQDGATVLVNRGWVPLAFDSPPIREASPPGGRVTIEGVVRLNQQPSRLGPVEPAGVLQQIARVDLDRLSTQFDDLAPVWIEITEENPGIESGAIPGSAPEVEDNGPHVEYAIQWFSFAMIGVVGFAVMVRRAARREAEQ